MWENQVFFFLGGLVGFAMKQTYQHIRFFRFNEFFWDCSLLGRIVAGIAMLSICQW